MKHSLSFFFFPVFLTFFTLLVKGNGCPSTACVFGWREISVDDPHLKEAYESVKDQMEPMDKYKIGYAIAKGLEGPFEYKICLVVLNENRLPFPCLVDITIELGTPRYKLKGHLCGDVI